MSQENQPQYEVPVPQQHNVHKSNEVGKICKDYETLHNEWLHIFFCRDMQNAAVGGFTFRQRCVTSLVSISETIKLIVAVSDC